MDPRTALKAERRAARERDLGARIQALPNKSYGFILADPEWRYEPYSRITGMDRAAENHYPTSDIDTIKARDVQSIAAPHSILGLWTTGPFLDQALAVIPAWGFTYKSSLVWIKDKIGTGFWFRYKHEFLLIATRGKPVAPALGTQIPSVLVAPRGRHSEKPDAVAEMVERLWPNTPKIELNRRGAPRPGWDAWGNEVEE